ncbi:MAG: hypothetical protein Q8R29_00610 [bacterium]|nr:hypothetical protein [bacterium]
MPVQSLFSTQRFEEALKFIPEVNGTPVIKGKKFKVAVHDPFVQFDLETQDSNRTFIFQCADKGFMQILSVAMPVMCEIEWMMARSILAFAKVGIKCGICHHPIYLKREITGAKVQDFIKEIEAQEISANAKRKPVLYGTSWDMLIDHLVAEKGVVVGKYWEFINESVPKIFVKIELFSNERTARTFLRAAIKRDLIKRIGPKLGKETRWQIFNLPWNHSANGKTDSNDIPSEQEERAQEFNPSVVVQVITEAIIGKKDLSPVLKEIFAGHDPQRISSDLILACNVFIREKQDAIKMLEKAKTGVIAYTQLVSL